MVHGGQVGAKRTATEVVEGGLFRCFGSADDRGFQGRENSQAGGLTQWHQANHGRDKVGGESLQERYRGWVFSDAVRPGNRPDRDRIWYAFGGVWKTPGGSGKHEGLPLIKRFAL